MKKYNDIMRKLDAEIENQSAKSKPSKGGFLSPAKQEVQSEDKSINAQLVRYISMIRKQKKEIIK